MHRFLVALGAALLSAAGAADARAQTCELARPVIFAGLDYDSAAFHTAVASHIVRHGYGCAVDRLPGSTIPLITGVARGDIDIIMEIWTANPAQAWVDAEKAGRVVRLGTAFPDAVEGWFVPRSLVYGEDAQARGLKSVTDLVRFKDLFRDPEEPGKGRFYNCIPGWQCEVVNSKKLIAYGLADSYTNFRPGSGEALAAAVESAVKQKRPIVFYYWGPTWLLGKYEFVKLDEPPFDKATWEKMLASERPTAATAFPVSEVVVGANKAFVEAAPQIAAFLRAYKTSNRITSEFLAVMRDSDGSAEKAARQFLATREEVWRDWVPAAVAERVRASLK